MRKRRLIAITAIVFALALLVGCAQSGESSQTTDGLQPITVGADVYPPYSSNDENGVPSGIDVDSATEAFRRIGYKPEFTYIPWEKKTERLAAGDIDCIMSCFSMTGREDDYRWAGPYLASRQVIAVDPQSSIYSLSDLAGKTIAVQATTKPESIILNGTNADMPEVGKVFSFSDRSYLVPALSKGYVDAIAAHETSVLQYVKDFSVDLRVLDESLLDVGLGCAFDLNDERGIAEALQGAFDDMLADGTMESILKRYFDDPSPFLNVEGLHG